MLILRDGILFCLVNGRHPGPSLLYGPYLPLIGEGDSSPAGRAAHDWARRLALVLEGRKEKAIKVGESRRIRHAH